MSDPISFMNEQVDPTGQANGQGGTVIRRYTSPPPPTPPAPAVPTVPGTPTTPDLLTQDRFTANRTGNVDENAIRENVRQQNQSTIDAINAEYSNLISQQQTTNENNTGQTRAVNARSGLLGSDFGNANAAGQEKVNNQALKALQDEQNQKITAVNQQINSSAQGEIAAKKAEALGNADAYSKYLSDAQAKAEGHLADLAKSGVDLDQLGDNKAKLFQQAGIDPALGELIYNAQKPKASQIDFKIEKLADGSVLFYGNDPTTGKLVTQKYDYPIPPDYNLTMTADGTPLLMNKTTGDIKIAPGFNQGQFPAPKKVTGGGGGGGGDNGGFTDDTTNFWAQAASSGVNTNSLIPSLGMGASAVAAKEAILNKIATNAQTLGIDGQTFGAMLTDSKAKQKAYSALQTQGSQNQVNEQSAGKYFDTLGSLADKVDASVLKTGAPILDGWIRSGVVATSGDPTVNNFVTQMTEALTEYAKVMSGQTTGAGVDSTARAAAQGLLSKGFSASTIKSFVNVAKQNMSDRTSSYDSALKGLFGNIQQIQSSTGGLGGDSSSNTPSNTDKDPLNLGL